MKVAFRKSRRCQSKDDYETWLHESVANTLNTFDGGDTRATTLIVEVVNDERTDSAGIKSESCNDNR